MTTPQKSGFLLPAVIVLVLGAVVGSIALRATRRDAPLATPSPRRTGSARPTRPAVETAAALGGRVGPLTGADVEAARRERIRERIREEGASTYLAGTLSETDSMLRRWPDDRVDRPLRVAIIRQPVEGFREEFVANVAWAVGRWNGVVPVGLTTGADSADADIVVTWTTRMDSNRTGRTDLTWDRRGRIHRAFIVMATHTPEGQRLDSRRISALALHEVGHALGLGHSPRRDDALYPVTLARELSERDRRTARLLYELPPGSLR